MIRFALLPLLLMLLASAVTVLACTPGLVVYWGQNSYGVINSADKSKWEGRLKDYCDSGLVGTVIISFMDVFGQGKATAANFANHCDPANVYSGTGMPDCGEVQDDVQACRSKGVKVEIGLGGASGSYGFTSDSDASDFAEQLNDLAFSGKGDVRPFGKEGVDGVNLDIEDGNPKGYVAFVKRLRELDSKVHISGAPQCVYPDASLKEALEGAPVDEVYVQFYNNACGVQAFGTDSFNFKQWADWSKNTAITKGAKVFLGVPASPSAAGSGYITPDKLAEITKSLAHDYKDVFGGVMLWDASQAFGNIVDGKSYAQHAHDALSQVC